MPKDVDPAGALNSIREARAGLGRKFDYPVGWDILFWMVKWWRDRFGWWVNAWAPKKARWVVFAMWPLLIGCIALSIWTRYFGGPLWAPLLGGGLAFVVTFAFGRWWMRVYRRELAEGTH